jgi:hypothetical protein
MPFTSIQVKFTVEVLGVGGPAIVLLSMFLNWTKASSFFEVISYSMSWAWVNVI